MSAHLRSGVDSSRFTMGEMAQPEETVQPAAISDPAPYRHRAVCDRAVPRAAVGSSAVEAGVSCRQRCVGLVFLKVRCRFMARVWRCVRPAIKPGAQGDRAG